MVPQAGAESLINSLREGVVMFDTQRRVTFMNRSAEAFTGLPARTVSLAQVLELFAGSALQRFVESVLATRQAAHVGEARLGFKFFDVQVVTLADQAGEMTGGALVLHDISEAKNMDQMRRDFMNVAAHDLRTPLTAVKGFVQMIRRGDFGAPPVGEIAQALADVEDGADRMISLVNDFLTLSRVQQGRFKIEALAEDLAPILQQALDEVAVTARDRPVALRLNAEEGLPPVLADKSKIVQVLVNLMDNALKHTERGSITITARRGQGGMVQVTEENTGQSIPTEDMPHLFEQYYKGHQRELAPGRGGGLGLGLHIVKMIVEAHGGGIWAENLAGKQGVAFHFTLPIVKKQ